MQLDLPEPVFRANVTTEPADAQYYGWIYVCTIEVGYVEIFKRCYGDAYVTQGLKQTPHGNEYMVTSVVYNETEAMNKLLEDFGLSLKLKIGD